MATGRVLYCPMVLAAMLCCAPGCSDDGGGIPDTAVSQDSGLDSQADTGPVSDALPNPDHHAVPPYYDYIGQSCAITGTCPHPQLQCAYGKDSADAYCIGACSSDLDCPDGYICGGTNPGCHRRSFCAPCAADTDCPAPLKCVSAGGSKFCSKACNAGSTECPKYAECKDIGAGEHYCVHMAGKCIGNGDLCEPCYFSATCTGTARCAQSPWSQESFCTSDCTATKTCPTGYDCVAFSSSSSQCVPTGPSCVSQLKPHMEKGDIMDDLAMVGYRDTDSDGSLKGEALQVVKLSDYAASAKVILFNVSTDACAKTKTESADFADLLSTYGGKGLAIFQVLSADPAASAPSKITNVTLDAWLATVDFGGACGMDPWFTAYTYNTNKTTPLNMLLDAKTRKVLEKLYDYDKATLTGYLDTYLGL